MIQIAQHNVDQHAMTDLSHIHHNIKHIRNEIAEAAANAGRDPDSVTLVAVTKTYPSSYVAAAVHAGITDAGENKIQEAVPKIEELNNDLSYTRLKWHLIGHLQSNKAKLAVRNFDLIHSVDSLKLAKEINRHAEAAGKLMGILIQINVSGEESKEGLRPEDAGNTLKAILEECSHVSIQGLMTMAPFGAPEDSRQTFKDLRELRDHLSSDISHPRIELKELSMGMSNDFKVAIEEGSTMVRIGTAIFGERNYS